jgi:G6PDH family F420-dependent oxidoreductase
MIGYALSSEEHPAPTLVDNARRAEAMGFDALIISDHFHPWLERQGQSPFVWATIGAIASATQRIRVGTGVTCPSFRMHPAIVAQAAATAATLLPGRFFLGVGSGEALNEHVIDGRWPGASERLDRLEEAIGVIRALWSGETITLRGSAFSVREARVFSLPESPPPILVAAGGKASARLAARVGDGLIMTSASERVVSEYRKAGGSGTQWGKVTVCWAKRLGEAVETAQRQWANSAIPGRLGQELPSFRDFEDAAKLVTARDINREIVCGPDPQPYLEEIERFRKAGFENVYLHQVGPDQEGFFRFAEEEILPRALAA